MFIQFAGFPRAFVAAWLLVGCGDDFSASDAGASVRAEERLDAAAVDSGAPDAQGGSSADAGRPTMMGGAAADVADARSLGDNEQALTLRFRAQLGEQRLACGTTYQQPGGARQSITLRDLRLFVQDVALVDAAGREVPVQLDNREPWQTRDVALLDFEDATGECFASVETNREISGVVPKGDYRALRFSHGVPEKLNHSDPQTFPAPLRTPGMSWNWLLGLRFVRFEVGAEPEPDADAGGGTGSYSLHVGSTGCKGSQNEGTIKCAKPNRSRVELTDFELNKSEIVLDVSPLLSGSDLSQSVECHSGTADCEPLFEALGVSYATGEPSSAQTVFRLN